MFCELLFTVLYKDKIISSLMWINLQNDAVKDAFCNLLREEFASVPCHDVLLLIGDYNAQLNGNCNEMPMPIYYDCSALIIVCVLEIRTFNLSNDTR